MEDNKQPADITINETVLRQTKEQLNQLHELNRLKRAAATTKNEINAVLTDIQQFQREHNLPISVSGRLTLPLSDEETVQEKSLIDQLKKQQLKNNALDNLLNQYREKRMFIVWEQAKNEPYNP